MRSLKITLSYDGTDYCGWQTQPNGQSIQDRVEAAIYAVTKQRTRVTASGRTDAGVHAMGQVASCDVNCGLPVDVMQRAINANLPADIRVLRIDDSLPGFHAIRDAHSKRYRYVIQDGGVLDVFAQHYCWFVPQELNQQLMSAAGQLLVGTRDFASFQAAGSPRASTIRTIHEINIKRSEVSLSKQIVCEFTADGFLYNMVRNMVGTLVEVGQGRRPVEWIQNVLAARDRSEAGITAPPQGLFLVSVYY